MSNRTQSNTNVYTYVGPVGIGGMAKVSHYSSTKYGKVAVKELLPEFASNDKIVSMFLKEANRMVNLNHPNIADVLSGIYLFNDPNRPAMVMSLIEGPTLEQMIENNPLPWESDNDILLQNVKIITAQVLSALHFTHRLPPEEEGPVLHLDIKPSNIMISWEDEIDEDGEIKKMAKVRLLDFGISQSKGESSQGGTPDYMPPEQSPQFSNGKVDTSSDFYALGVTLYHTLSGSLPWGKDADSISDEALQQRKKAKKIVHISDLVPDLPYHVAETIMVLLEPKQSDRFQTSEELFKAFQLTDPNKHLYSDELSRNHDSDKDVDNLVTSVKFNRTSGIFLILFVIFCFSVILASL